MVRPGPKTTQDEVKTAVLRLLEEHPDGLNFNEVFRRLKSQKVLGSFSVLSRAMKELHKSGVVEYKDAKVSRYKIPKRIYTLSPTMMSTLKDHFVLEGEVPTRNVEVVLRELSIRETTLLELFLMHTLKLASVYRVILSEKNPLDKNAKWKLLLNREFNLERLFMNDIAKAVSEGKVSIEETEKLIYRVGNAILQITKAI